jgi:thiol-disulfide isomerase/thioredoxin
MHLTVWGLQWEALSIVLSAAFVKHPGLIEPFFVALPTLLRFRGRTQRFRVYEIRLAIFQVFVTFPSLSRLETHFLMSPDFVGDTIHPRSPDSPSGKSISICQRSIHFLFEDRKEVVVMKRHHFTVCATSLLLACFVIPKPIRSAEPVPHSGINWQPDLQAAHRESLRLNRPVLIVFGAEWCHFCDKLEKESLGHPQVAQYINQSFIPVHLDFDQAQREARILDVKAIPCVVALTPQAELVGRLDGFAAPRNVAEMLTSAARKQAQLQQSRLTQTAGRSPTEASIR